MNTVLSVTLAILSISYSGRAEDGAQFFRIPERFDRIERGAGGGPPLGLKCRGAWEWSMKCHGPEGGSTPGEATDVPNTAATSSSQTTVAPSPYEVAGVTYMERGMMAAGWSTIQEFYTAEVNHCAELCVTSCHCDGFILSANTCHLVKNSKCSNLPELYPCEAVRENGGLYMEKLQGSCKSVQLPGCTTEDGEYRLNVGPQNQWPAALIFCHEMNTSTPSEFITLPAPSTFIFASAYENLPNQGRKCRHTRFNKVKINPSTLIIDQSADVPFTNDMTPTGGLGDTTERKGFGIIAGCSAYIPCSTTDKMKNVGTLSINFQGTSFTIPRTTFLDSRTKHIGLGQTKDYTWKSYILGCSRELEYTYSVASGNTLRTGTCTDTTYPSPQRRVYLKLKKSTQTLKAKVDGACGGLFFADTISSRYNVFRLACI